MRATRPSSHLAFVSLLTAALSFTACDSAVEPRSSGVRGPQRNAQLSSTNVPVTVLPDLGAGGGMVMSIDSHGHAVGQAFTNPQSGFPRAVLWVNGQLFDLGTPGGWSATATAINDDHVIVGFMTPPASAASHAFRWANGVLTDLGTFGGEGAAVYDMNAAGQMAGYFANAGQKTVIRIRPDLSFEALTPPPGISNVEPTAINADGLIVGVASSFVFPFGSVQSSVLWEMDGTAVSLGSGIVESINTGREYAGWESSGGSAFAFRGTTSSRIPLDALSPGASTFAYHINDAGDVVGTSNLTAVVWRNGSATPQSLGTIGGYGSHAQTINNAGLIGGYADDGVKSYGAIWGTLPPGDWDGDGAADAVDNCLMIPNPSQSDVDADGLGDACDPIDNRPDSDFDGVIDATDNCPAVWNASQSDVDADGIGDACDPVDNRVLDADADGVLDAADNCPLVANPSQSDLDDDGAGDACDAPTAASLAQALTARVQALVASGVLNAGNGNALLAKLRAGSFAAFVNQVSAFEKTGRLTAAQAKALRDRALAAMSG